MGDTPTSSDGESKEKNPKPWITDSQTLSFKRNEDRFMDNVKDLLKQYPQRTETYERINMAQLAYSPEEYVGRRFVFDGCAVRQRFRPADEYLAHRTLAGYVAFDIKPLTGGKKYGAYDDDIVFVAKKSFFKQWIPRIKGENDQWPWCVVSGIIQEFKNHKGVAFYAFVIDEFIICGDLGKISLDDIFSENPISNKNSPELKSFIAITARKDLYYEMSLDMRFGNK